MTVLKEILAWSQDRPKWQRDALRRLVVQGTLSEDDISALSELCKAQHGLAEPKTIDPLVNKHVRSNGAANAPVSLDSIFHHCGVNALAENQTLKFGPNLTLVYGDNAAGKTGYIRILKSACRARGQEEILGNVVADSVPRKPIVAIKFNIGNNGKQYEWAGQGEDEFVSRVSVFDAQSASVYLTEETDVAFRPFGLDLFDKLVKACKAIRAKLEKEQQSLASKLLSPLEEKIPEGTLAAGLLANITSLTKPESVKRLSRLSKKEISRLKQLERSILDFRANEPKKLTRQLKLQAERVSALARHLRRVEELLSEETVNSVLEAKTKKLRTSKKAERLRETTFPPDLLTGTGSQSWSALWEAARTFSQEDAYPGQTFPVVEKNAHCLLCQQEFDRDSRHRLQQFESFVTSTSEKDLQKARKSLAALQKSYTEFQVTPESVDETLKEIHIDHEQLSERIREALARAEVRRIAVSQALSTDQDLAADCPSFAPVAREVESLAGQITNRANVLQAGDKDQTIDKIQAEVQELRARKLLSEHEQEVLDEIERKRKYAAYSLCINDTKTRGITQKSTALTRNAVTQKLKQSFKDELSRLSFQHVEVQLEEAGGREGVLYHKLILTRAPGIKLPKVVSEGEQRCLSIAAFFAELSTADDPSGIVFDDPVSSLDYKWREAVALRLVEEAKQRQVIAFTHDVVFLLLLKQCAAQERVGQFDQHVRQLPKGAGVCIQELPWVALKASKRVRYLNNLWQAAEKLHREGHQDAYERNAREIYGYLREAWERGLEEVLLGGVVERYRPNVQTQQVALISDITVDDCSTVEAAMTNCSRWLRGHDQAPAARADIPEPPVIKEEIDTLADWIRSIRRRRRHPQGAVSV